MKPIRSPLFVLVLFTLPATLAQPAGFEVARFRGKQETTAPHLTKQGPDVIDGRAAEGPDSLFERPAAVTLAELAARRTRGVSAVEVNDYAPGHYTGALTPSPPHADMNAQEGRGGLLEETIPSGSSSATKPVTARCWSCPAAPPCATSSSKATWANAELFNNMGRKEKNSFVDIIQSGPRRGLGAVDLFRRQHERRHDSPACAGRRIISPIPTDWSCAG